MNACATTPAIAGASPLFLVAIVDDDAGVRHWLRVTLSRWQRLMLGGTRPFECVLEFASGDAALAHLALNDMSVVMMDLEMPGTDGVTCIRRLRERGYTGKVVVLSDDLDGQLMQEAAHAGADFFLIKPLNLGNLKAALEYCRSFGIPFISDLRSNLESPQPPVTAAKVADPMLTKLENRILEELQTGYTYAQIADRLKLSGTVLKKHVNAVYRKLGANSRTMAIRHWHQHLQGQTPA